MPCSSSDGMGTTCNHSDLYREALAARREADELARMLCDLCGDLEEVGSLGLSFIQKHRRIREWWDAHKAQDQRGRR